MLNLVSLLSVVGCVYGIDPGATSTYTFTGDSPSTDNGLKDQIHIASLILSHHAELFSSLVDGCDPERLREPRHTQIMFGPSYIKVKGASGGAGSFVGLFANWTGAKVRKNTCFVGRLSLRGKLIEVSSLNDNEWD